MKRFFYTLGGIGAAVTGWLFAASFPVQNAQYSWGEALCAASFVPAGAFALAGLLRLLNSRKFALSVVACGLLAFLGYSISISMLNTGIIFLGFQINQ